jgi:hypothetical protein
MKESLGAEDGSKPKFFSATEPEGENAIIGTLDGSGNWVSVEPPISLLVFRDGNTVRLVPRELAGEYKEWKTPQRRDAPPEGHE